jgi:hypothetical protein
MLKNNTLSYPTKEQKLLLQACLLSGEKAINAWQKWRKLVDIDYLDDYSNGWLSLLYYNLAIHQVEDAEIPRLKGIYKRTWYANQLKLKEISLILHTFQEKNIPLILLGDLALTSNICKNHGLFLIWDYKFFISAKNNILAIKCLQDIDWMTTVEDINNNEKCLLSYLNFQKKEQQKLLLYNYLFWATPQNNVNEQIWHHTKDGNINNIQTNFLSPTDECLFLCQQAFLKENPWELEPWQLNNLVKIMLIINHQNQTLDWERLLTQAQQYNLILPLKNMLIILQELFTPNLPDWLLSYID